LRNKIVYFSFYFNLKIVRFFCQTLYNKNKLSFIKVFIGIVTNNRLFISIDILILQSGWGKELDCETFAQERHKKKKKTVFTQAVGRCGM